ncbi:MAG: Hint domain-containing protein [Rhodopila sp.]
MLTSAAAGDIYGFTYLWDDTAGTFFKVAAGTHTVTTMATFDSTAFLNLIGCIADAAGDFFGFMNDASGDSSVVELAAGSDSFTTLATFNANNGAYTGGLGADAAGNLYGTAGGGANNDGTVFEITDSGYVTAEEAGLCFLTGTMIATPSAEVAVDSLSVGDMVLTLRGQTRPIVWIGVGRVLATRGQRSAATPVIVRKGALSDNVPHSDLLVTKGHALFLDDVLIPVEFLVNHHSILWDDHAQEVRLYHIELACHDVLIAHGASAESYRDDGNRWLFRNANSGWGLPAQPPCAPVLTGGPVVDAAWRRLRQRARAHTTLPLTDDPDLHLLVGGCRVDAEERHGAAHVFRLRKVTGNVRIVSRAAAPAELGLARDPRLLGVAVRRLAVRQGGRFRVTEADDAILDAGFHAFEADNGWRWTDGDASLPMSLFTGFKGSLELMLHLGGTTQYVADAGRRRAA